MSRSALAGAALLLAIATAARAHPPSGIVADGPEGVLVVDSRGNRVLRVAPDGAVRILFHDPEGKRLSRPHHLARAPDGALYTVSDVGGVVWRVDPAGSIERVYPPEDWYGIEFTGTGGDPFTVGSDGTLYLVNERQFVHSQILRVTKEGRIGVLAGGAWGLADGKGEDARLRNLHLAAFVWGPGPAIWFTDGGTCVRKVLLDGTVATVAGGAEAGFADGPAATARFSSVRGLAVAADGSVYLADAGNRRVRKVSPDGVVSTFAGSGEEGGADGPAAKATFREPTGLALAPDGVLWLLDAARDSTAVRRVGTDGLVATVATVP